MLRTLIALIALLCLPPVMATIESVTVFPDRATVSRVTDTEVKAGSGEWVVSDLPTGLSRDSLRLSAQGPEGLRLGAFQFRTVRGSEQVSPRAREIELRIEALVGERDRVDDALRARQLQITLLESLAGGAGQGDAKLSIEGWDRALQTIGSGAEDVLGARRELSEERVKLDREIERLQRELADLGQSQRDSLELVVAWESSSAGAARLHVEYSAGGASWRPVYEWRLDTETSVLTLVQFAEVRQRTGEDWSNAELELSLARPSAGGQLPELTPWWIDVARPPAAEALDRARVTGARREQAQFAAAPVAEAEWDSAQIGGTEFTRAWRVPGKASVAADNQPHRFRLDEHSLDVSLSARMVPRRQATAWLYAEGEYEAEDALPPGTATLYQDRTLVGQIRFAGVAPGGTIASSFGVDERISVDYRLLADERATTGMLRKSTRLTRRYGIEITNGHSRAIAVTVLDQMPVSRDERIDVSLTDATTPPDQRDVDDKPGVLAWNRSVGPGATLNLTISYRLSFPEDLEGVQGW